MSSAKLFFFDLDGTLLNSEKKITPATYAALNAWHEAGHRIAISSGRPLPSVLSAIRENGLLRFSPYAIAFNGAQIHDVASSRDIAKHTVPLAWVAAIAKLSRTYGLHCHSYDDTHILTPADDEEIAYYTRVVKLPVRVLPDFPLGMTQPPCKLLVIDLLGPARLDALADEIKERAAALDPASHAPDASATPASIEACEADDKACATDHRSCIPNAEPCATDDKACIPNAEPCVRALRSNPYYLEVFPSTAGKGAAVAALAAHLGIPIENTCAAGDEQNDISMIQAAGTGVAMCNGNPAVFPTADLVTSQDNDHDGLAPILRRLL